MKTFKTNLLLGAGLTILLFLRCNKEDSFLYNLINANVEFEDVWLEDMVDIDGDGYFSDGKIFFDLKSNKALGVKCYVNVFAKRSVYLDSNLYHGLCRSNDYNVIHQNTNKWSIPVGECFGNRERDFYHLMLEVCQSSDNFSQDKVSNDEDLYYIPLEPAEEDTLSKSLASY